MSVWLGAPDRKTKMQLRAVLSSVGETAASTRGGFRTSAKYEPTTVVPAILKKRRREKPFPKTGKLPPNRQASHFFSDICDLLLRPSVVEELQLVQQRELEVFGLGREGPALQVRDGPRPLRGGWIPAERGEIERVDDRVRIRRRLERALHVGAGRGVPAAGHD